MNKNYKFSKAFLGCAIVSAAIILSGIVSFFIRGINFGIDFQPGLMEEVRIADAAMEITYKGSATVSIDASATALDVVISNVISANSRGASWPLVIRLLINVKQLSSVILL